MTTVLITGAAGMIASELRKRLSPKFSLKLTDIAPVGPLSEREEFVAADLADMARLESMMAGVDAVVHLGGIAVEEAWEKIMPANVAGAYNLFEAARRAGVRRIVVASSNHAVGFFPRSETIDDRVLPRPDGRYGLSKAFAEMLGRLYADKYRMEVFCIRIGAMTLEPEDVRRLAIWIHPEDLVSLVEIGITAPGVKLRDRLRHVGQQAQLVGQPQCAAARIQAQTSIRRLCGGGHRARAAARSERSGRNLPGRRVRHRGVRGASEVRDTAGRQQMKIDRLRAFMSRDKDRPRVIVSIDTDDGLTGWGECYNHGPDKALAPILDYLFDFIRGHDPRRIEYLVQLLMQQSRFPPGALTSRRSRRSTNACGTFRPRRSNVPVYRLLGGHVRDRVKVYAGVYTAPDPAAARDEFDRLNAQCGLTAFKLSPYRVDMHRHRWGEVVRTSGGVFSQLRETVRADYEIAFDAHAKIFEVAQAMQLGNALAPYDPLFFEEPLRPENFEAWGELKAGSAARSRPASRSTAASSSCGCCR